MGRRGQSLLFDCAMPPFPSFFECYNSIMKRAIFLLIALSLAGCGYHRLDRAANTAPWAASGGTISLGRIFNNTKQGGLEEVFKKAVENRIVAASPWKLVAPGSGSRWVLQGSIDSYEIIPLGLNLVASNVRGAAGSATRIEVVIVASLRLYNGENGEIAMDRPRLTFRSQYRLDQNFASFDTKEIQIIEEIADDFAESFLTQLLAGRD
jgi:hypothetical protein